MGSEMFDVRCLLSKGERSRCAPSTVKPRATNIRAGIRAGISLIEILISMFVLLFGLMGVAAIFPVGDHYVVEGEKFDLGSNLSQNAFQELRARGMLDPKFWYYANVPNGASPGNNELFIQNTGNPGFFNVPAPLFTDPPADPHPGHAFVLDPLGTAIGLTALTPNLEGFPLWDLESDTATESLPMPAGWSSAIQAAGINPGGTWPIRRLTLPQASGLPFTTAVAETIFRLRDDLAVEYPDEGDQPSRQLWSDDGAGNLLARQYQGSYSWLATVVPTSNASLLGLQGEDDGYGDYTCEVSAVVFHKRVPVPSAETEKLITAEFQAKGEVLLYGPTDNAAGAELVDAAVEEIRPGNWIAICGVDQVTGTFLMKWYRILALDEETELGQGVATAGSTRAGRRAMLDGPDWPESSYESLRAILLPGVIGVSTQNLKMKGDDTMWSYE